MAASLTIRPSTADDWQLLKTLRLASLLDAPMAFGMTHASAAEYDEAAWRERASPHTGARFLLALADGEAVGLVGHHVTAAGAEWNLIAMWVRPDWRGRGVAPSLVEAVKALAIAQGVGRIVLEVAPDNGRAAALYQRQGFVFLPEWETLASHPQIELQKMAWQATI